MGNLLYKELRLSLHPTSYIFLALSLLMLVPNYPYYVTFFYMTLAVFFTCLSGRENQDLLYMALLPVRKRDIVSARMVSSCMLELALMVLCVPFAIIRQGMDLPGNQVGMDANIALFGLSLMMLGLFNLMFFTRYYRNPDKVGRAFVLGSTVMFAFMAAAEVLDHVLPVFTEQLDTPDPAFLVPKLVCLALGALVYVALTLVAWRTSRGSLERIDL
jgi:hypothetical protein